MDEYVTVDVAAKSTGIAARTIRYWIANGKLTATAEKRGKLVRLSEVEQIGTLTGRRNGNGNGNGRRSNSTVATAVAAAGPVAIATDRAGLALIRDEWLRPFVEENGQLREELGRERLRREIAEAELERLRASQRPAEQSSVQTPNVVPGGAGEAERASEKPRRRGWLARLWGWE